MIDKGFSFPVEPFQHYLTEQALASILNPDAPNQDGVIREKLIEAGAMVE